MSYTKAFSSIVIPVVFVLLTAIELGKTTYAEEIKRAPKTAQISGAIESKTINRRDVLINFFKKYNSPLKDNVDTFIDVADKYGIDYRLLPAISCMESTCGKHLLPNSYNPFGWGIYGNNAIYFKNYDEAILTVGKGLNEGYFKKGLNTPEKIAPVYTPPNSHNWYAGVSHFINEMNTISKQI